MLMQFWLYVKNTFKLQLYECKLQMSCFYCITFTSKLKVFNLSNYMFQGSGVNTNKCMENKP